MKSPKSFVALLSPALFLSDVCSAQADIYYDTTWAGPVRIAELDLNSSSANSSSGFNFVEATLVMPHLAIPQNPHQNVDGYTASFWIGLDGFLTSAESSGVRGLWQAGVIMSIWANGTTEYTGFYEWVPEDPISINSSQLAISEGDHLHVVLNTINGGYHASTTLTNLNTSQTFSYSQDAPVSWRGPTWPAPGTSAEWIIEAGTYLNGTQYVLPDFGNASFLDARACYNTTGACVRPGDDHLISTSQTTAVWWNDTDTLYTRSYVNEDDAWVAYVEEVLTA